MRIAKILITSSLLVAASAVLAAPAFAGPPWLSIELPANPYDRATRDALFVIHTYHHGTIVGMPVHVSAEGLVDGERRSVTLSARATPHPGEYAVFGDIPRDGVWLVAATGMQGTEPITMIIDIDPDGAVRGVRVPTHQQDGWVIPSRVSADDITGMLRKRAGGHTLVGSAGSSHGAFFLAGLSALALIPVVVRKT